MANWIEPVFDRTQTDCDNKTAKGSLSVADLNRIEGNMRYIDERIIELGYYTTIQVNSEYPWTRIKYLKTAAMNKIEATIIALSETFYNYPGTPVLTLSIANEPLSYTQINLIEYYLYNLKWLIDWTIRVAPICGETYCGE